MVQHNCIELPSQQGENLRFELTQHVVGISIRDVVERIGNLVERRTHHLQSQYGVFKGRLGGNGGYRRDFASQLLDGFADGWHVVIVFNFSKGWYAERGLPVLAKRIVSELRLIHSGQRIGGLGCIAACWRVDLW